MEAIDKHSRICTREIYTQLKSFAKAAAMVFIDGTDYMKRNIVIFIFHIISLSFCFTNVIQSSFMLVSIICFKSNKLLVQKRKKKLNANENPLKTPKNLTVHLRHVSVIKNDSNLRPRHIKLCNSM